MAFDVLACTRQREQDLVVSAGGVRGRQPARHERRVPAVDRLDRGAAAGRIAVDDFGTGYSSLACLQPFPVDRLKIDRSFTSAITTSPESGALIGTLVQLGKDLGLATLAAGVETVDELDHLRAQHVQEAQGVLLSRPLDPDVFETQLLEPTLPPDSPTKGRRRVHR
jgi:EAL domain-containing protein (putative c-di-GMP-specific phosphodiesterase class I)